MGIIEKLSNGEIQKLDNTLGHLIYDTTNNELLINNGKYFVSVSNSDDSNINNEILDKIKILQEIIITDTLTGTLMTSVQPNIEQIGVLNNLELTGNITGVNKLETVDILGNLLTSDQPNIKKIGKLKSLELEGPITGVTSIIAKDLTGLMLTNKQPNITSVGILKELTISGKLNIKNIDTTIIQEEQLNIRSLGNLHKLDISGITNINTTSNQKQLNVNSKTGECLRLINNEKEYSDFIIDKVGNLNINPSGGYLKTNKTILINNNGIGFSHISDGGVKYITTIDNNSSVSSGSSSNHPYYLITNNKNRIMIDTTGNVGIGTNLPTANLCINGTTGGNIRLIYNNSIGTEKVYSEYSITEYGNVIFKLNGRPNANFSFEGGNVKAILSTSSQPNITSLGTLKQLNVNGPIDGITTLTAELINGIILTDKQPNIKSIGELDNLKVQSNSSLIFNSTQSIIAFFKNKIKNSSSLIEISNELDTKMSIGIHNSDPTSVIISCLSHGDLKFLTKSIDRICIKNSGLVGINTNNPTNQLTINSSNGKCISLVYNNTDTKSEYTIDSTGHVTITSYGSKPGFSFIGGTVNAILSKSEQPNITSLGTLTKLNVLGKITGVTELEANTITGIIMSPIQLNITTIGTLKKLNIVDTLYCEINKENGKLTEFKNINSKYGSYIEILNDKNNKAIFGLGGEDLGKSDISDVILGNYSNGGLKFITNSTEKMTILPNGYIGINTTNPIKQFTISNTNGECIRLINTFNKSVDNHFADINVLLNGNLQINTTGSNTEIKSNNLIIGNNSMDINVIKFHGIGNKINTTMIMERIYSGDDSTELLLYKGNTFKDRIRIRSSEILFQTFTELDEMEDTIKDNNQHLIIKNDGLIGINTNNPNKQLCINSKTGECLRMIHNNTESYLDYTISKKGEVTMNVNGEDAVFKFVGGGVEAIILTSEQPNITSLGTLTHLNISGAINADILSVNELETIITTTYQPNISRVGTLEELKVDGYFKLNTDITSHQLNINNEEGKCISLIKNNNQVGLDVDNDGNLNIETSGNYIITKKQYQILNNSIGFSHKSQSDVELITSVSDIHGVSIGSYSDNSLNLITNNISRLIINTKGQIGIGTNKPNAILDLGSTATNASLFIYNNNNNIYGFGVLKSTLLYQAGENCDHAWYNNSTQTNCGKELMRLDGKNGYLGIGTSLPKSPLHIESSNIGITQTDGDLIFNTNINKLSKCINFQTTTNHSIAFGTNNKKEQLILSTYGNVGIGTNDPNGLLHLKHNMKNMFIIENDSDTNTNIQYKTKQDTWDLGIKSLNNSFYLDNSTGNKLSILSNGKIGINTINPNTQLCINNNNGNCLRLVYNNNTGTETTYLDCNISETGVVTFNANGSKPKFNFIGGGINGILETSEQPNITSIGILKNLEVSGNITGIESLTAKTLVGKLKSSNQSNIQRVGTLTELNVSGIITNHNNGGLLMREYTDKLLISEKIITELDINSTSEFIEIIGYINPSNTGLYTININNNNNYKIWINNILLNTPYDEFNIDLKEDEWYSIYIQCYHITTHNTTVMWKSDEQTKEIINSNSLAWDNHIDRSILQTPFTASDFIQIYNSDTLNNSIGEISVNSEGDLLLTSTNDLVIIDGNLSATLITSEQPNITSIGILEMLELNGDIIGVNNLRAKNLTGSLLTPYQPYITHVGTLDNLKVTGNISDVILLSAISISGTILTPDQPHITSIGTLDKLKVTGVISDVTLLSATSISGLILTPEQPHITSIGTLDELKVNGEVIIRNKLEINNSLKIINGDKSAEINIDSNGNLELLPMGDIYINKQIELNNDGFGLIHSNNNGIKLCTYTNEYDNYSTIGNHSDHPLHLVTNTLNRLSIDTYGLISINTVSTMAQLNINSSLGECLRLIHNNTTGTEEMYADFHVDTNGVLQLISSGNTIYTTSCLKIQSENEYAISLLSPNGSSEYITKVSQAGITLGSLTNTTLSFLTNNEQRLLIDIFGNIGINTLSTKSQLTINSENGNCIRLLKNNNVHIYSDIMIDSSNNLNLITTGQSIIINHNNKDDISQMKTLISGNNKNKNSHQIEWYNDRSNTINKLVANLNIEKIDDNTSSIKFGTSNKTTGIKDRLVIDSVGKIIITNSIILIADKRLQENIKSLDDQFCKDFINNTNPVEYNYTN